uniref:KIAA0040 n=1 Tax=Oryzias latipes TaxID=8090 RepID=A0A3B3HPP2_ORYLA
MEWKIESIQDFFNQLWSFVTDKHNQGVYNTICLAVVLTLPLLVLLTAVLVCCHCCCCPHKKKNSSNNEDLWISALTFESCITACRIEKKPVALFV